MYRRRHPLVGELSLYDIVGTEGVAADISHIDTGAKVRRYTAEVLSNCVVGLQTAKPTVLHHFRTADTGGASCKICSSILQSSRLRI